MAIIVLILLVELLLAILLPAPNMGAPIRRLLGVRQGERKALRWARVAPHDAGAGGGKLKRDGLLGKVHLQL